MIVILPNTQFNDVVQMIEKSHVMNDISVSRPISRTSWGIPVPGDDSHVIYVWLDALVNYLTVTGYPWSDASQMIEKGWPCSYHFVGQDIIKFHAIYWPAFLLAAGLPLPKRIVSHGHWLKDHTKMSKSLGNVVDPFQYLETYGSDAIRYFLLREGDISNNPEFSDFELKSRYKNDLQGQLGNLILRATSKAVNPSQVVPSLEWNVLDDESKLHLESLNTLRDQVDVTFQEARFNDGIEIIMSFIKNMNKYMQVREPWKRVKHLDDSKALLEYRIALYTVFETLRITALLLGPVIPVASQKILDTLVVPVSQRNFDYALVGMGCSSTDRSLAQADRLFAPLDDHEARIKK